MIQNYEFTVIFDADEEKMKAGYELVPLSAAVQRSQRKKISE